MRLVFREKTSPENGVIHVSTNMYDLPKIELSGATLRMVIPELSLAVVIKIPR